MEETKMLLVIGNGFDLTAMGDPFEKLLIKYCNNIARMESRHLGLTKELNAL